MEHIVEEVQPIFGAKITVIGVGGGGSNAIANLVQSEGIAQCIKIIAANTDKQHLDSSPAPYKIHLGGGTIQGLGAGMNPEVGRDAAFESQDQIREMLEGSHIVFIATGLGGGTGTGASPVIAQIAKELGALTVSVVTKPFRSEGQKKTRIADAGLKNLREESDSIIVVPNDRLRSVIPPRAGIKESYRVVDSVLMQAVTGIAGVMLNYGENDMNVDFADVKTVMGHRGLALMGIGEAEGDNAASEAVKNALSSPLLDSVSIVGAMGILVNFEISEDYPFLELEDAFTIIEEYANSEADVKFGTMTKNVGGDRVRVTIIATGFEKELMKSEEESIKEEKQTQKAMQSIKHEIDVKSFIRRDFDREGVNLDLDAPSYMREK
ncbi:cell division protein FtsZ [Helicobacter pametensis]|uniref:cell division protein FtsZ n=1 Tax=Helicobacter pametensis TaxID=95149 RepID=UPI000487F9AC|nr:cell division protein FtsZ [Helicobacter pametensis]